MKRQIIKIAGVLAVCSTGLLSAGCGKQPDCINPPHKFSKWEDEWKELNDFGAMRQRRYCEKCGMIQIQISGQGEGT